MNRLRDVVIVSALLAAPLVSGCTTLRFPEQALTVERAGVAERFGYDLNGDGVVDYIETADATGRVVRIERLASPSDGESWAVDLADIKPAECRHVILALDGVPFRLVEEYQQSGGFRLFHKPQRMVAPFPSMTDLSFADIFSGPKPLGFETAFYDRRAGKLSDGSALYLDGSNEKWVGHIQYRQPVYMDAVMYVYRRWAFRKELRDMQQALESTNANPFIAYFASSSGLGTAEGLDGFQYELELVDRFSHELFAQCRGKVHLTLLADHGHTLRLGREAGVAGTLKRTGYRVADRLKDPKDVVMGRLGLVTYSAMWTNAPPAEVADALLTNPGVEQAFYLNGDAVEVKDRRGVARIHGKAGKYRYEIVTGDPLVLKPIMDGLASAGELDEQGFVDSRVSFNATVMHLYPDALARVWRAFHGMVDYTPDLVVTLRDDRWEGAQGFGGWVRVQSTHGSLNTHNSTTFVMSTAGEVPRPIRTTDFREAMHRLFPEHDLSNQPAASPQPPPKK
jgi:hypothetical protein